MAQICTPEYGYEGYSYMVEGQCDLDNITAGCTTVNGSISMSVNYTGGFYLPNIRNITGNIRWYLSEPLDAVPKTTSMHLPDLEFLGGTLDVSSIPTLQSFVAPQLQTVEWAANIEYAQEVDLRSLVDLEYLTITGNVSSLRLDSLRQVRQDILICNMDECDSKNSPNGVLNVSLPALHDTGHLNAEGRFSSFDTPNLTNLTGFGTAFYNIKLVTSGEAPINISFPELKYIQGEDLQSISVSIPDISNMTAWFSVNAYNQLDINLPFQEAQDILLTGNISSVQFPNLTSVDTFTVNSVASLDLMFGVVVGVVIGLL
ncbi:hypothetical protein PISL3812_01159 [Talaromyces islandicus]|uniref:Protein ecm33 n=1 Tax=Talaromyces islandicus TaxID=28573 RepID=A0A0U1LLD4_TALIS|nr:hypothetical protein PISL3812_01159 [Talaromyces islandicus]